MKLIETDCIELKEKLTDDLEKEAVAFLNTEGGDFYIGVRSDGTIVGVRGDVDTEVQKIKGRLLDKISPSPMGLVSIKTEDHDGKMIIKISLQKGREPLYNIKDKGVSEAGCFIRVGTSAQPMTRDMIHRLQSQIMLRTLLSLISPEQNLVFGDLFIHYKAKKKPLDEKTFDRTLDFRTADGRWNYLAYLMADNNRISVRFARFDDSDNDFKLEEKSIDFGDRCLITGLKQLLDRMEVENITLSKLTGAAERIDMRLVDNKSMREVIINAFTHNDYSTGMLPICEVFQNRFAVRSYGELPYGLTKEEFFAGVSHYRNPELIRIFKDLEITEGLGFGIRKILKVYDKNIFHFGGGNLYVQLPFDKKVMASRNEDRLKTTARKSRVNSKDEILRLMKDNPSITISELAESLRLTIKGIEYQITKMRKQKIINREGSRKAGIWKILKTTRV